MTGLLTTLTTWNRTPTRHNVGQESSAPQTEASDSGYRTYYYETGERKAHGPIVDGKPDGRWLVWDRDGHLQWQYEFADGKRHGKFVLFDPQGNIVEYYVFEHGELIESHPKGR